MRTYREPMSPHEDRHDEPVNPLDCASGRGPRSLAVVIEETVRRQVSTLAHDERKVINALLGLDGQPARTPADLARELGRSMEEIQRIESQAIRALRGYGSQTSARGL